MFLMSHRIHTDLYRVSKFMPDPGNGGTIRVTEDLQICEMVSTGTETRTLANPTKQGLRFIFRLLTDGGDVAVTASNGLNASGNTVATFEEASDLLQIMSVQTATGFRWDIVHNIGSVALS
jgi:hypothetical protein